MSVYLGTNCVDYLKINKQKEKTVRFIDYDGETLYEYSKDAFLALSSMPSNPTHSGLIAQGWNWSLSDAQAYVQEWGYLNIGQLYTTSSGGTEIDIYFPPDCIRLSPYLSLAVNGAVKILWGDSAEYTTVTGTSLTTKINTPHTYSQPGSYTITIEVTSGSFAFYSPNSTNFTLLNANDSSNNMVYSSKVKNIRIGENCIIDTYAFYNCYSLQSVTTSNSVTSIKAYAFQNCYSLQSITIPNGVTSIGTYAFQNCYSLKSITIPNGVTSISQYAFSNCYSLRSLIIPNSVTTISSTSVSEIVFVKIIPNSGMSFHTTGLTLTIPYGVTSIDTYDFYKCYFLQSVTIPNSVTSIGNNAFAYCCSLQSITIPDSVTTINNNAFYQCYSLQSITIPSTVTSIGQYAFYNCRSLQSITIPSGVTSISKSAFSTCYSLQSVTLPDTITSISSTAFDYCYSLQSITIPSTVTSIGSNAFYGCYSLSSITIPSIVTSIGSNAFYNCSGMKEYHLKPTTPPTLGYTVFSNIPSDCIIYVPKGSLSAYQTATNWSEYASYMQEENN